MDLLEKSKSDKQNEKNMEGENSGPSRQTEVSESDNHEDDNTGNEGPGPSSQMSASCSNKRKDIPWKRKMEISSSNLEKKIKRSRIETDASRIEEDAIVNEQFSYKHCEAKFSSMGSLKCNICGKQFHSKIDFTRHFSIHNNEGNFVCDFCPKVFKNKQTRKVHMKIHTRKEEDKFECDVCGKRFGRKDNLKRHKQTEHPEEDSPTNEQRGQSLEEIDAQLTTHENERNFVCEFCPKAFKTLHNRKRHMKIHSRKEEDKYECDVCGKHFLYKSNLNRHKRTEHPEEDSPTNEQRDHSLVESDAKLSPSRIGSTFGQDLQRREKVDLEQHKNDSQESKRNMDEISEYENEPENFIHCQSEIGDKEHDSQSDTEIFRKNSNIYRVIKLKNYSSRFNLI